MEDVKLLYVEDSKASQRLFESIAAPIAEYYTASSLEEARQLIESHRFTFFVLDYNLPDGNALEFVGQLRADPRYSHTPIILYTACLDQDMEFLAMKSGVNESLAKPMHALDLRQHIVKLIATPSAVKTVRRNLIQMTCYSWCADGKYHGYSADFNHHIENESHQAVREQMHEFLRQKLQAVDDPDQYPRDIDVFKCIIEMDVDDFKASA